MAQSARFAWWLLIMLFALAIFSNSFTFLALFTRREKAPYPDEQILRELKFKVQYAVMVAKFPTWLAGDSKREVRDTIGWITKHFYGTAAEWEGRLYVAMLERLAKVGDAQRTLQGLGDAPSLTLAPSERRWFAPLWRAALLEPLDKGQVQALRAALSPSADPMLLGLVESLMWERAGDTQRAQRQMQAFVREAQLRFGLLAIGACCGLLWAIVGFGLLIWYLVRLLPSLGRTVPLPNDSPFTLDSMLWAPALFLLVQSAVAVLLFDLESTGVALTSLSVLVPYFVAVGVALLYLLSWVREGSNRAAVLGLQVVGMRGVRSLLGATLMGFGIYLPLLLLSLLIMAGVIPALPSEQTNPIAERALSELSAWELFWTVALTVVFAPIVEEVLFRGVLFQVLWQRTGRVWLSAFASGFLFSVIHPQFLGGILNLTFLGVVLAMVYAHTRSLIPCMLIHALNNGMLLLLSWVFLS
jgi:membrane protease YdiL (CAAX protease family)